MTHRQSDPRVQRTDQVLQTAFIELADEYGFDAVTIGDIVKRARVNRATFYRHYEDKFALMERIFRDVIVQFTCELGPPGEEARRMDPASPPARWVKLFEHFKQHARLYRTLLGRKGSTWFVAKVRDHFITLMEEREERRASLAGARGQGFQSRMPRKIAMTLAANLLISTVAWWLESGTEYSPQQMASWFLDLAINGYVRVLGL